MIRIDPDVYYDEETLRIWGLDGQALRLAREAGELRHKLVGHKVLYKGTWLSDWLNRSEQEVKQ